MLANGVTAFYNATLETNANYVMHKSTDGWLSPFLAVQTLSETALYLPMSVGMSDSKSKERPCKLVTFETFDQSDEETWPDQKKHWKDKYKDKDNDKDITELHQRAILETCDLWHIWSEWWEDMTWPKKDKYKNKDSDKDK